MRNYHNIAEYYLYLNIAMLSNKLKKMIAVGVMSAVPFMTVMAVGHAPVGWHKVYNDTCQGVNLDRALAYLKSQNLKPVREIVVGIIDSGVDTASVDIAPALWHNPGERLDGKDNDGNGYTDDMLGWNFLGTKDGSFNMTSAGTEEFREFKRLYPKYKDADSAAVADRSEYDYYRSMRRKAGIDSYIMMATYTARKGDCYRLIDSVGRVHFPEKMDTMTVKVMAALLPDEENVAMSLQAILPDFMRQSGDVTWKDLYEKHRRDLALMRSRLNSIETVPDKRLLMGDNLKDASDIHYGNPCIDVEGCEHGTFVAGVIAGQGIGEKGCAGIFPQSRVMILRAAPDGDEYDKDIATAIRYAVDNGAKVVNMSIGKTCSPDSAMVSDAVAYALAHDVLLIQAAGNSHKDIDSSPYFPTGCDRNGAKYENYMRVGASDMAGAPAGMSNYGRNEVDVFAPGVDIRSTTVGNTYMYADGTSVACPVASGVAALLRAYFPSLKAGQIKDILVKSCRSNDSLSSMCRGGGVIDACEAVKIAMEY